MPDPSYMSIRFETLQQAENDLAMTYAAIKATVDDLATELLNSLNEGHWSGAAADAYWAAKGQWDTAVGKMAQVLNQFHVHMANAAEMYQTVEAQNVSIWH